MSIDPIYLTPDGILRAITLWPEWVWAIHHLDKRIENRSWEIPRGEWFGLHAGKHVGGRKGGPATIEGWEGVRAMAAAAGWTPATGTWRYFDFKKGDRSVSRDPTLPLESHIHGLLRVKDYVYRGSAAWFAPGQVGNVFDYVPLAKPVPCKGEQGLWTVQEDVRAQLEVGR